MQRAGHGKKRLRLKRSSKWKLWRTREFLVAPLTTRSILSYYEWWENDEAPWSTESFREWDLDEVESMRDYWFYARCFKEQY